jgi:hypothetical protein
MKQEEMMRFALTNLVNAPLPKIVRVKLTKINEHDELRLVLTKRSENIIFEGKSEDPEGFAYLKIYDDGLADYGYTVYNDSFHGGRYTWSSNPTYINEVFHLNGTDLELAKLEHAYKMIGEGCYYSCGMLASTAALIASAQDLNYGILKFLKDNCYVTEQLLDHVLPGTRVIDARFIRSNEGDIFSLLSAGDKLYFTTYHVLIEYLYELRGHTPSKFEPNELIN